MFTVSRRSCDYRLYNVQLSEMTKGENLMKKMIAVLLMASLILTMTSCAPKKPRDTVSYAKDLIDDGRIDKAVDVLEEIIDDEEEDYEAWEALVEAYIEDEEYEDAADVLEDMAKIIEDNYEEDDDDIEDAMEAYEELSANIMKEEDSIRINAIRDIIAGLEDDNPDQDETIEDDGDNQDDSDTDDGNGDEGDTDDGDIDESGSDDEYDDNHGTINSGVPSINGNVLKLDEALYVTHSTGTVDVMFYMSEQNFSDVFGGTFDDDLDTLKRNVQFQFEGEGTKVTNMYMSGDGLVIFLVVEDFREIFNYVDTVQNEVDYYADGIYSDMNTNFPFYYFEDKAMFSEEDYRTNKDDVIFNVNSILFGTYFVFPYPVEAVSDNGFIQFDEITMYIEPGMYLDVILKEPFVDFLPTTDDFEEVDDASGDEVLPDSESFLLPNEYLYIYDEDGTVIVEVFLAFEEFESQFGVDSTQSAEALIDEIDGLYEGVEGDPIVIDLVKYNSGIDITVLYMSAATVFYTQPLSEYASDYYEGDFSQLLATEALVDYNTGAMATPEDLEAIGNHLLVPFNGEFATVYAQLPGDISYVTEGLDYTIIASDFIQLNNSIPGVIVFDGVFGE